MNSVLRLIHDYVSDIEIAVNFFASRYGRRDILRAWKEGSIPISVTIEGGLSYHIHGRGCLFEFSDHEVDVDFNDWEGGFGFDSWRLMLYAKNFPHRYPDLQDDSLIVANLKKCASNGTIVEIPDNGGVFKLVKLN